MTLLAWLGCAALICFAATGAVAVMALRELRNDGQHST